VTAYVGNVHFTRPIENGDLIEIAARIVHTGRSSMQVGRGSGSWRRRWT
jgi:acyl-CoA hydrolase